MPVALLIVLALLAAGCGGSGDRLSASEYERELTPVLTEVNSSLLKLGLGISRAPAARLVRPRVRNLERQLSAAADDLERMRPPEDVEDPHRELARAVRALAGRVAELAKPDPDRRQRPTAGFMDAVLASEEFAAITRSARAIRDLGYAVDE